MEATYKERRKNKRIPAKFKLTYIHEGDYLISFTKDISVGGMFIYTENPPPVGDCPELFFSIGELRNIKIKTRVVWVNKAPSPKDTGVAVEFLDLNESMKEAILKYVNRIAVLEDEIIG